MGYASNQFYNASSYMDPSELNPDEYTNPRFLWPGGTRKHSEPFNQNGTWVDKPDVRRGFIRMLTMTKGGTAADTMEKRRCFFQFNPDKITRSVSMREDMMHPLLQSPAEFSLPVPGNSTFGFTLMFDRSFELNNATTEVSPTSPSYGRGVDNPSGDFFIPEGDYLLTASPDKIGVLSDIRILDAIVGQGISQDMIDYILERGEIYQTHLEAKNASTSSDTSTSSGEQVLAWVDLMSGASGDTVTKVQQALLLNDPTLSTTYANFVDGHYGTHTTLAVKAYQDSKDLPNTGIVNSATAASLGVERTEPVSTPTSSATASKWNAEKVRSGLDQNIGNQAFLLPNPVRVVFSSLFMVDGFVTSMTVSHVRFNENMVPMTCYVDVQMQALYLGFARKDTFLTSALKQAEALQPSTPTKDTPTLDVIKDKASYESLKDLVFNQRALKDFKLVVRNAIHSQDILSGLMSNSRGDWEDDSLWPSNANYYYDYDLPRNRDLLSGDDYIKKTDDAYEEFEWFFPGIFGEQSIPFRYGFKQSASTESDEIFKAFTNEIEITNISWDWEVKVERKALTSFEIATYPNDKTLLFQCSGSDSVSTSEEWRTLRRQNSTTVPNTAFSIAENGRCCYPLTGEGKIDIGAWRANAPTWMSKSDVFLCTFSLNGSISDSKGNTIYFYGDKEWKQRMGNTIKISVTPTINKKSTGGKKTQSGVVIS